MEPSATAEPGYTPETSKAATGLRADNLSAVETLAQSISTIAPTATPALTIPLVFALAGKPASEKAAPKGLTSSATNNPSDPGTTVSTGWPTGMLTSRSTFSLRAVRFQISCPVVSVASNR